jgi:hypothetical protein
MHASLRITTSDDCRYLQNRHDTLKQILPACSWPTTRSCGLITFKRSWKRKHEIAVVNYNCHVSEIIIYVQAYWKIHIDLQACNPLISFSNFHSWIVERRARIWHNRIYQMRFVFCVHPLFIFIINIFLCVYGYPGKSAESYSEWCLNTWENLERNSFQVFIVTNINYCC